MNKGKILIIEDNQINLEMIRILLQDAGYQTIEAEDAITGIRKAQEEHPNLVLMDLHLPRMDGYDATRILKSRSETQNIPVVALTAMAMPEDTEKALAAGCENVIHKPIDIGSFTDTIGRMIHPT